VDDDRTFGRQEAFDWIYRRQLTSQAEVASFATEAQALPQAATRSLAAVARSGHADERQLAVAALRCRGCSVFRSDQGLVIDGPTLRVQGWGRSSKLLVPAADSLTITDLLAAIPTELPVLPSGSRTLSRWLSHVFGSGKHRT
jgi:hypothetical protein